MNVVFLTQKEHTMLALLPILKVQLFYSHSSLMHVTLQEGKPTIHIIYSENAYT